MTFLNTLLKRWWSWSLGPGKRRKLIGFGLPLLLALVVITALTPSPPEAAEDRLTLTPTPVSTASSSSAGATAGATSEPTLPGAGTTPVREATPRNGGREAAVIVEVVDGDTVVLEGGARLRYIGIDTPETVTPGAPVACFGPEASARNAALVLGQTVFVERDESETDRFDRLLRYVYLEDGRMVNEVLAAEGYAWSKAYPPDTKHQDTLDAAQEAARSAGLGLWAACPVEPASTARPAATPTPPSSGVLGECPQGCDVPPAGCAIKGNISSERIFHVPGQRDYDKTIIDPDKGERWFCTEAEAVANGWRKAQR